MLLQKEIVVLLFWTDIHLRDFWDLWKISLKGILKFMKILQSRNDITLYNSS